MIGKLTLLATAAGVMTVASAAPAAAAPKYIPNQYICTFDASVAAADVDRRSARAVAALGGRKLHSYKHAIKGFAVRLPNANANPQAMLKRNGFSVDSCEMDQEATLVFPVKAKAPGGKPGKPDKPGKPPKDGGGDPTDPPASDPPTSPSQSTPWGIARVNGGVSGASGTAWVLDTGIADHWDLNVDYSRAFTAFNDDAKDRQGHGTHVAGTIAAIDNGYGVIGVAAGATVVPVKVLSDSGSGSYSGVIAGVDHVAANGSNGDVANMSLGGGYSQSLNDAVSAAAATGVKFSLAAGNESTSATTKSPASAEGDNVYTVSSFASGDNWSSFSNYGNPPVDYAEPGSSIRSTVPGSVYNGKDNAYATYSGTSMAAPHLAGLMLLGNVRTDGTVNGDPDGNPDPIGVR
ncbi:S8 family serine peptidase [Sphingomicrobium marinum]|uniref:S8 family serine peptidase n=1 Tax=Sphingomicrobium marinum TaxID=1227950 RepID=UPI00223ECEE8|nr:S8 family serine peptidase [Sphingomicrobium marinum]